MDGIREKSRNKELLSGTVIYAIGSFGTKILSFLFVPLYTYYILPADMGVYDLIMTTISLLVPIVSIQIGDAAYRWLISGEENREECLSAAYRRLVVNLVLITVILLLAYQVIKYPYPVYFYAILTGNCIFGTVQKLLRGVRNQKLFAGSGIVYTIIFLTLNIVQICFLGRGIEGMLLSSAVAYWSAALVILAGEKRIRHFPKRALFYLGSLEKKMILFALPLIPNQLNWWIVSCSDRYIVRAFLGNEWNGIYSIAYKFPSMLQSIFSLFTNSWQDVTIADREENQSAYYSRVFDKYSVFVFTVVLMAIPASRLYVRFFMNEQYLAAANYISFLYLGSAFQTFAAYFGAGYLKSGDTRGASITSIFGAGVNIIVNLLLIRVWGLQAASFSTFLGFFAMWLMRVRQTKKSLAIRLNYVRLGLYGGLVMLAAVISIWSWIWMDLTMLLAGAVVFLFSNMKEKRLIS